ncbi:MAG: hypothetical protein ACKVQT_36130 [Burkholderiales bacterium]
MLEMLVLDQPLRAEYVSIAARIPARIRVDGIASTALPSQWPSVRQSEALRRVGTEWLERTNTVNFGTRRRRRSNPDQSHRVS